MFKGLKSAHGAGYRAGYAGAASTAYPSKIGLLARVFWQEGWYEGMHDRLKYWLYSNTEKGA